MAPRIPPARTVGDRRHDRCVTPSSASALVRPTPRPISIFLATGGWKLLCKVSPCWWLLRPVVCGSGDCVQLRSRLPAADGSVSKRRRPSLSRPTGPPPTKPRPCPWPPAATSTSPPRASATANTASSKASSPTSSGCARSCPTAARLSRDARTGSPCSRFATGLQHPTSNIAQRASPQRTRPPTRPAQCGSKVSHASPQYLRLAPPNEAPCPESRGRGDRIRGVAAVRRSGLDDVSPSATALGIE